MRVGVNGIAAAAHRHFQTCKVKQRKGHIARNLRALPAMTMRKGSVQKTRLRARASRLALMAMDSSMGSSGGMTDVMIMLQCRNSLKRLRSVSCAGVSSDPSINKLHFCTCGMHGIYGGITPVTITLQCRNSVERLRSTNACVWGTVWQS